MDKITRGFFEKIKYDVDVIVSGTEELLKNKFQQILAISQNTSFSSYDKIMAVANILEDVVKYAVDSAYKRNIASILSNLLEVAKETEDQYLIDMAIKIVSAISASTLI